jgi:hypothetical protein
MEDPGKPIGDAGGQAWAAAPARVPSRDRFLKRKKASASTPGFCS